MGPVKFINPNNPVQPQQGVYGWFFEKQNRKIAIYIGSAGRRETIRFPSTLARGLCELQRSCLASNTGRTKLDTDFIVGTAINYLRNKGYTCFWKHLHNDPGKEAELCSEYCPKLQEHSTRIAQRFRIENPKGWRSRCIKDAEESLYREFRALF